MRIRRIFTLGIVFLLSSMTMPGGVAHADGDDAFNLGVAAFRGGDFKHALTSFNAAMAAHPDVKVALYLGNTYLKLGDLSAAKGALQRALRLGPQSAKRSAILALIHAIDAKNVGELAIKTQPPGAFITIDAEKKPRGQTPLVLKLPIGAHTVKATLAGYEDDVVPETIELHERTDAELVLRAKGCALALSATPAAAQAQLDGSEPVALPTTTTITPGDHRVVFSAAGFVPSDVTASCALGKAIALDVTLVAAPGRVKLTVEPGSVVTIDGELTKLSTEDAAMGVGLPPGKHEIEVKTPGRPPWKTTVEVASGAEVGVVPPTPEPPPAPVLAPIVVARPIAHTARRFPHLGLYFGIEGGGNAVLRDWDLGKNAFEPQSGTGGIHPHSSGIAGARVGVQAFSRLAVEAEFHWVGLPTVLDLSSGISYDLNILFHVLKRRWTPIVEAGIGIYQVVGGRLGHDVDPRGHVGIGVRGRVTDRLAVRLEVRDVFSDGFDRGGSNNLELLAGVELFAWRRN